jgi:peptidoglycan/LPS O-acetylase OafA/YrhL
MNPTSPKTQKTRSQAAHSMVRPLSAGEILLIRRWLRLLPLLWLFLLLVVVLVVVWRVSDER